LAFWQAAAPAPQPPNATQRAEIAAKSERARDAMSAGRFTEAVPLYQDLVRALPGVAGLRMNLGIALHMAGQYRESVRQLEQALRLDANLPEALLFLGAGQQRLGNAASAVPPLRRYVQQAGRDGRGRQLLGDALLELEKFDAAVEQFGSLSRLEPQNPRAWYGLGRAYEGLAAAAFAALERAAPESGYWFALVAATRVAQNQYRSGFYLYRKALEKNPRLRGIHVALARIYRETGHPDWAAEEERREGELGLPDCGSEKAVCDFLARRFDQVLADVAKEQTPQGSYWRSQAYNQLALDAFSALGKLPRSFELHEVVAGMHRNQGRHLQAVEEWKRALELDPGNRMAETELAVALVLARDYDAARPRVEKLLAGSPDSAQLNYLAGEVWLNQQKPQDAVPFLLKTLKYDPGNRAARASLGRAYVALGESVKAIPHLKAALDGDRDGSLHYQLARAYRAAGQTALADQMLEKFQAMQTSREQEKQRLEEEVKITPP